MIVGCARIACVAGIACLCVDAVAEGLDLSVRAKAFASRALLPEDDAQRAASGTPADDLDLDLRLIGRYAAGRWKVLADHETTYSVGDGVAFRTAPQATLDQTQSDDDRRLFDLTWTIDDGDRHRTTHRFDRLAAEYELDGWRATIGRQAVSWGSGIVFNPMDLFNPFAPTVVDRDYKAGDDLIEVDRLLANGGDLQLLVVGRRDEDHDVTRDAASAGGKWRQPFGNGEVEVVAGRHYADGVVGISLHAPLGGALVRSDWVYTSLDDGGGDLSWLVNVDYTFTLAERNVYTFAEWFTNGFGVDDEPIDVLQLPLALIDRLQRGETFTLMEHYVALGTRIEWHPLVSQTATWIANADDGSSLVQLQVSWDPGDAQRIEAGLTNTFGDKGEEYGGVEIGGGLATGDSTQLYVRWVYHW